MGYIGSIPADKYQTLQKQSFSTSATDTYTLSYAVTNPQDLALFINNVRQNPNDAYTVSGTTLTLSAAITGSDTMYAVFLGKAVETIAPATGTVNLDMLSATGTKDATTFLAGDNSFKTVSGTTINNNADNRVITGSGTANTLEGEANLIFDGSKLGVNVTPVRHFHLHDDTQPYLHMTNNTTGTTTGDGFDIIIDSSTGKAILNNRENQPIEFMTNNNARMAIDANGHLLPNASNTYDLGSSSLVWRNIYTSDFHMSNEGLDKGNDIDGTKGSWTFQEGADDLFLLNNKNGKKYKFNLTEMK